MVETIVIIFVGIFVMPFVLWLWLYGWTMLKKLYEHGNWTRTKSLERTVQTWQRLTPEQRMEAVLEQEDEDSTIATGGWVESPTADEEVRQMNEKAFQEGLIHKTPEGTFEEAKPEIKRPLP